MSRVCDRCGKKPFTGYSISHAHNKTKKRSYPNLQKVRVLEEGRTRTLNLCTRCIRTGGYVKAV